MIATTQRDAVLEVMINRPERLNSLDLGTLVELEDAIASVSARGARALLLYGAGGHFCAGADLRRVGEVLESNWDEVDEMLMSCGRILTALRKVPAAVVCAFEGVAIGAGAALALAADLVVAAPTARLAMGSFKLGMTPDGGLSFLLARAIGQRNLVKMALLSTELDADAMREFGIATEVVAEGRVVDRARELADQVARTAPPLALVGLRELADSSTVQGLDAQFDVEAQWVRRLRRTRDFHEGITAFLERRAPAFVGQ